MHSELFEKTAKLEEVLLDKQQHIVLYPRMLIIPKNFDVPHATTGSFPLLKSIKLKLNKTKNMTQKTTKTDYLYT